MACIEQLFGHISLRDDRAETNSMCAPSCCIALRTCLETARLAYARQCRVSPDAVVRAMPNTTMQPVANNVRHTDVNVSSQVRNATAGATPVLHVPTRTEL